jgi:hypothetical protein
MKLQKGDPCRFKDCKNTMIYGGKKGELHQFMLSGNDVPVVTLKQADMYLIEKVEARL